MKMRLSQLRPRGERGIARGLELGLACVSVLLLVGEVFGWSGYEAGSQVLMGLGIACLLALPVLRILASILYYRESRQNWLVAMAAVTIGLLMISAILARFGAHQ